MRTQSSLDLYAKVFMLLHILVLRKCNSLMMTAERTLIYVDQTQGQFRLVPSKFGLYPQNFQKAWFM